MSDQVQTQESGGGEGLATPVPQSPPPAPVSEETKPVETVPAEEVKEVKQEEVKEVKQEEVKEVKQEESKEVIAQVAPETDEKPVDTAKTETVEVTPSEAKPDEAIVENNAAPKETDNWQERESTLLKKIEELEKVKNARTEDGLKLELKVREEEIDLLKARLRNLETELHAALSKPSGKNHEMIENIKQQHEELLSKARGMIFDKTKMVKNQELQIEALTTQVQSLKDINVITKDLLEIRNSEVKAMEERFSAMEARYKAEKERYSLVLQRAQTSTNINQDLRQEYETQLAIFKELREKYELRVQALVAENNKLKADAKGAGPST